MKLAVLFLLVCLNFCAYAQVKPIYFRGDMMVKDSTIATSYGIYGKLSNEDLWVIKRYDLYDNLMLTGSYKDEEFNIPHGEFTYYSDVDKFNETNETNFTLKGRTRFIVGRGRFEDGLQTGRWITFFPDEKIRTITTFVKGVKHGPYYEYNRRGKIKVSGNYKLNEKDGKWIENYKQKNDVYQNAW
jgi:antitoxin component YwqK of YwqJK toxin-antitoxin module